MRLVAETGKNFSTFLAARVIFVTVLLGVAALFRPAASSALPYLGLLTANAVFSLGCWEWFRRQKLDRSLQWVAMAGAVCLDTLVLHYAGGPGSEFVFLYFFSVGSAGLMTGLRGSLLTAALASFGIIWLYRAESARFFVEHGFHAFFYAVNFFLTAFLTSYVYDRFRERERRHEQTLGELEQTRLDTQAILDSLTTGVLVVGADHAVLYSNPAGRSILGLSAAATVADVQAALKRGTALGKTVELFIHANEHDERNEIEASISGAAKPIGFSSSPLFDMAGDLRGYIVLFSDLTKVKDAERVDRERERLAVIGRLSRDLAHGIRNPLATVRGCVEMMQSAQPGDQDNAAYFELALRESDRLNTMLRDFLRFAHLGSPNKQPGDLAAIIRHHLAHGTRTVTAEDHLPEQMILEFDADQIGIAIDALLLTLAEWSEGKDHIILDTIGNGAGRIRMRLPGTIISSEIRDAAFLPFANAQRSSSGLALPTAQRAVHAHGGELLLQAEPESGTWFELALR